MDQLKILFKSINFTLPANSTLFAKAASSFIIIFILWVIHRIIIAIVQKRTDNIKILYAWKKGSAYFTTIIAFLLVARLWFQGIQSLATFLGLLSAGLAIALRDIIADIAGWAYIIWVRPFNIGDRININSDRGDIIDIGLLKFTILEVDNHKNSGQSTGCMLHIPNSKIFANSINNETLGFEYIWDEIPVLLTFESNWKKAKKYFEKLLEKTIDINTVKIERQFKRAKREYMIHYKNLTPIVYTCVEDCGVLLTLRYICDPHERRDVRQNLWENILDEFTKHSDIDFAYPTNRIYRMNEEKPALTK